MKTFLIYYGSQEKIIKPVYGFYKKNPPKEPKAFDYGDGFYCTKDVEAAKEWACSKGFVGIVNKYLIDQRSLLVKDLTKQIDDTSILTWIAILMHYRRDSNSADFLERYAKPLAFLESKYFTNIRRYDVVIGYRADDAYYTFPQEFVKGNITLETLSEAYFYGSLGEQYVLISKKAFDAVKFQGTIVPDKKYIDQYFTRLSAAKNKFHQKIIDDSQFNNPDGTRIYDLMKKEEQDD